MSPIRQNSQMTLGPVWRITIMLSMLSAIVSPFVSAINGGEGVMTLSSNSTKRAPIDDHVAGNFTTVTVGLQPSTNKTSASFREAPTSGLQARAASSYLASRAATGLQLKQLKSTGKSGGSDHGGSNHAMGDLVGLDTALESQMDLQTAAGEHKKYILVKKKPKHKKIKMEVYKPKMKYKKIKMKVPVKKMKKKKVKGYLVKKEKHY